MWLYLLCLVIFGASSVVAYKLMNVDWAKSRETPPEGMSMEDSQQFVLEVLEDELHRCRCCGKGVALFEKRCKICGTRLPAVGLYRLNLSLQIGVITAMLTFVLVGFYWT